MTCIQNYHVKSKWFYSVDLHILVLSFTTISTFCSSDGRFRIGDEIINVNGKSLRGLTIDEARYLLRSSCSSISNDVDIILARDPPPPMTDTNETLNKEISRPYSESVSSNLASTGVGANVGNGVNPTPVERRRRRRLPFIERPRSAPIHTLPSSSDDERSFLNMLHQQGNLMHQQQNVHGGVSNSHRSNNSNAGNGSTSCDNMTMASSNSVMDLNKVDNLYDQEDDSEDPNGTLKTVIKIGTNSQSIEHHHHHIHRLPPPLPPNSSRLHSQGSVSRQGSYQIARNKNSHFNKYAYHHGPNQGRTLPLL